MRGNRAFGNAVPCEDDRYPSVRQNIQRLARRQAEPTECPTGEQESDLPGLLGRRQHVMMIDKAAVRWCSLRIGITCRQLAIDLKKRPRLPVFQNKHFELVGSGWKHEGNAVVQAMTRNAVIIRIAREWRSRYGLGRQKQRSR